MRDFYKMKKEYKKIYLLGKGTTGWSIDKDRQHAIWAIQKAGYTITQNPFKADIIFCIWWKLLERKRYQFILKLWPTKKIIAVITEDLAHQIEALNRVKRKVNFWVFSNSKHAEVLKKINISEDRMFYNPYFVDPNIFYDNELSKSFFCKMHQIDPKLIKGKLLIGSFQRDSLGKDLTQPKWQKNPDLLLSILSKLDKNKYLLILGGPRRHYVINKCNALKVPYIFLGNKKPILELKDDLKINMVSLKKMNLFYNFTDLNLMTSSSEGGPKCIIENSLTKTPILATDVGIVSDFLDPQLICKSEAEFINKINQMIKSPNYYKIPIQNSYERTMEINSNYLKRTSNILRECLSK